MSAPDSTSTDGSDFEASGSYESFTTVLIINSCIGLGIFIVFGILRSFRRNSYFFAPNYYDQADTSAALPYPGKGLFSWIAPTVKFAEDELFTMRGLDAVIYLKFLKYMAILFLLLLPIGVGFLLPLDANGNALEDKDGVPALSLSNVPDNSSILWMHAIFAIYCTFVAFIVLYVFYDKYTKLRISWMKLDVARNYSVMYKGIPKDTLQHTTPMELFSQYFPGEIVDAQVGVRADGLRRLVKKWETINEKLQFARDALSENGARTTLRRPPVCGTKVDAIDYYQQKLARLNPKIEAKRREVLTEVENSQVGFVTFRTIGLATQNAQLLMDRDATKLVASPAPQPSDIYWKELELPRLWRPLVKPISWVLCAALILFWGSFVVIAQAVANLENLSHVKGFSWLSTVGSWNPALYGLVSGFLPALTIIILFALLPQILAAIVKIKGVYTHSQVKRSVLKYYYIFLVVNVFLVSILSGGTITIMKRVLHSTGSQILELLGEALPAQSSFFINYILTYALFTYPMNMLRPGAFIMSKIKKMKARSRAECRKAERPQEFKYELLCGIQLLMFVIGFTYAPIAPFVLPWTVLFYLITWLFGKYLLIYVYNPEYDSGGLFWPVIFNRLVAGMALGQATLVGVFIFKTHPAVFIVAPLPLISIGFGVAVNKLFNRPSTHLSMNEYPSAGTNGEVFANFFKDPVLQLDTHESNLMNRRKSSLLEAGMHRPLIGYGSI